MIRPFTLEGRNTKRCNYPLIYELALTGSCTTEAIPRLIVNLTVLQWVTDLKNILLHLLAPRLKQVQNWAQCVLNAVWNCFLPTETT